MSTQQDLLTTCSDLWNEYESEQSNLLEGNDQINTNNEKFDATKVNNIVSNLGGIDTILKFCLNNETFSTNNITLKQIENLKQLLLSNKKNNSNKKHPTLKSQLDSLSDFNIKSLNFGQTTIHELS